MPKSEVYSQQKSSKIHYQNKFSTNNPSTSKNDNEGFQEYGFSADGMERERSLTSNLNRRKSDDFSKILSPNHQGSESENTSTKVCKYVRKFALKA